jgi:hypothetical protein
MIDHDVLAYIADLTFFKMDVVHRKEILAGSKIATFFILLKTLSQ